MQSFILEEISQLVKSGFNSEQAINAINTIIQYRSSIFPCKFEEELTIITFINKTIFQSQKPVDGYKLLNYILFDISKENILPQSTKWVLNILPKEDPREVYMIDVLYKLIKICAGNQEFDKFLHTHLIKIVNICLADYNDEILLECIMNCLLICIQKYPRSCKFMKEKIETSLLKYFIVNNPPPVIEALGNVFSCLPKMEASTAQAWSSLFHKFCVTINKTFDILFVSIPEYTVSNESHDMTPFELDVEEGNAFTFLNNTVQLMACMLTVKCDYERTISVKPLFDVIKRGLVIDLYDQSMRSLRMMNFVADLYHLQINLLNLLKSSVKCIRSNWRPYASQINKLILDSQRRTFKSYFTHKCDYQKEVYETLIYWVTLTGDTFEPNEHDMILENILKDISLTDKPATPQHYRMIKGKVCEYALNACATVLPVVNLQANEKICTELFIFVINCLSAIQNNNAIHPYTNTKCVINLYKVLYSMLCKSNYNHLKFFSLVNNILNAEQIFRSKPNSEIIEVIADLRFIVQVSSLSQRIVNKSLLEHERLNLSKPDEAVQMVVESDQINAILDKSAHLEKRSTIDLILSELPKQIENMGTINESIEAKVSSEANIQKLKESMETVNESIEVNVAHISLESPHNDDYVEESVDVSNYGRIVTKELTNEIEINKNEKNGLHNYVNNSVQNEVSSVVNKSPSCNSLNLEDCGDSSSETEAYLNSFNNSIYNF